VTKIKTIIISSMALTRNRSIKKKERKYTEKEKRNKKNTFVYFAFIVFGGKKK